MYIWLFICVIFVKFNFKGIVNFLILVVNFMYFYFVKYFVILLDKKLSLIEILWDFFYFNFFDEFLES